MTWQQGWPTLTLLVLSSRTSVKYPRSLEFPGYGIRRGESINSGLPGPFVCFQQTGRDAVDLLQSACRYPPFAA